MPVDFTSTDGAATTSNEGSLFAPTPIWDRSSKKKRGGRSTAAQRASEPATYQAETHPSVGAYGAATASSPADTTFEARPLSASPRRASARRGVPTGAVAAGVAAVAALGAVGWYAAQPRDAGVTQLTPGAPAASQAALNTAATTSATTPATTQLASTAPAATPAEAMARTSSSTARATTPTAARRTTTTTTRRSEARVRPAEESSALDAGVNASAAAPVLAAPPANPAPAQTAPVTPATPDTTTSSTSSSTTAPAASTPAPQTTSPSVGGADGATSSTPAGAGVTP